MFAIIQIGSFQYKVAEGDTITADRLKDDVEKNITLDKVLMYAKGTDIRIGQPFLKDVKVSAKVMKHNLDNKITSLKYRRRKSSSTKWGHRQKLTTLSITKISV